MKTTVKTLALLLLAAFFGWSCAAISPPVYELEEQTVMEEPRAMGEFEEISEEEEEERWERLERWELLKEMSEHELEEE